MAATELDTRLVMRPLRNTERVLRNAAVDRLLEKERVLGADITLRGHRRPKSSASIRGSCSRARWTPASGRAAWSPA